MSNLHGLSDEQVSSELKRMVAFIKQEAIEKSREIHIKVPNPPSNILPVMVLTLRQPFGFRQTRNLQ
jgi:hypothetical protein